LVGYVEAVRGNSKVQQAYLSELTQPAQGGPSRSINMAMIYASLGRPAQALEALEKAYTMRESTLLWLNVIPVFDTLRTEPRFIDLVRRVGLPN
jgi:hypothetical protein